MSLSNVEYERRMKDLAVVNHTIKQQRAVSRGRAGTVHPYNALVRDMLHAAAETLQERLSYRGRGRSITGLIALRATKLKPQVVAAIAARTVVDGVVMRRRLQNVAQLTGTRVEDEVRMREFRRREPALWQHLQRQFKEQGTEHYTTQRKLLMAAFSKARSEEQWQPWDIKTRIELGLLILDSLEQAGFVVKRTDMTKPQRKVTLLDLHPDVQDMLLDVDAQSHWLLKPWFKPMLEPPMDWTSPNTGGYDTLPSTLVKTRRLTDLSRFATAQMPVVYQAINAVQRTPWQINEDVLVVAEELRRLRTEGVEGIPVADTVTAPERPAEVPREIPLAQLDPEQRAKIDAYKTAKRLWFEGRAKRNSKNLQAIQILDIAGELRHEGAIYFPHQMDYRGRMYPLPLQLNPQGNDLAKGLLRFAEARPLGEMGGYWLAVHGANLWGEDKGPLNERVDWVLEHGEDIKRCAADPLSDLWWTEADGGKNPFQFLAWCLEWSAYLDSGESPDFLSRLPVSVDGACNGIQHFAAMLRDPMAATATNLSSDPRQHDVYQEVADAVNARIRAMRHRSERDRELAGVWTEFGVTRKEVKRPVMTTPYGATKIGMKDMVLQDTVLKHPEFDWGGPGWEAAAWLSERISEAIGEQLVGATKVMSFLQELAAVASENGAPLVWTTPTGFPAYQRIMNERSFLVNTMLLGRVQLRYRVETAKIDKRRQKTSSAPNFVHSYDAAHLMLTVVGMERRLGRPVSWAMVHDSYGTHAGDVQVLGEVLREEFVAMYADKDPLEEIRRLVVMNVPQGTDIPEIPEKGTFDLQEVLQAEFFFA